MEYWHWQWVLIIQSFLPWWHRDIYTLNTGPAKWTIVFFWGGGGGVDMLLAWSLVSGSNVCCILTTWISDRFPNTLRSTHKRYITFLSSIDLKMMCLSRGSGCDARWDYSDELVGGWISVCSVGFQQFGCCCFEIKLKTVSSVHKQQTDHSIDRDLVNRGLYPSRVL